MAAKETLQTMRDNLNALDEQIADAQSYLRVMDASGHPDVIKIRADLAKARTMRDTMLKAINDELSRS